MRRKNLIAWFLVLLGAAPAFAADAPRVFNFSLGIGDNVTAANNDKPLSIFHAAFPQARIVGVCSAIANCIPKLTLAQRATSNAANTVGWDIYADATGLQFKDSVSSAVRMTINDSDGVVTFAAAPTFSALTATRVPFAGTAGALTDDADLTFVTDTLSATKLATTQITTSGALGAGIQGATTVKTLTDAAAAVAIANVTMPSNSYIGGYIDYSVEATDGTDFQARSGHLVFSAVSKGSAITCTVGTVSAAVEVVAVSSGTLAATWSCADATGGILALKATADTSLTPSAGFPRIRYRVNTTNAGVTIAPQ